MVQIHLKLSKHLKKFLPADEIEKESINLKLPQGSTVKGALNSIGIPSYIPMLLNLNDKKGNADDVLRDGDTLTVIALVQGG